MNQKKSIKSLIISHLEGNLNQDELRKLLIWISKSDENIKYYASIKDLWQASITNASKIAETEKEWIKFVGNIKKDYRSNIFRFKSNFQILSRLAAVLLIGIIIGSLVVNFLSKESPDYITSIAPKGSISQMILSDNTIIYLNAGSEIKYSPDNIRNKREVFLKGEAWFDVAKNKRMPFVVHTSAYNVSVIGTQFNVKAYESENEVITTLESGEVKIQSNSKYAISDDIVLKPGEQAILNLSSKKIMVKEVDTNFHTSWKNNKLMFLNMSVKDLIVLLERRYDINVEVKNPEILKYHYTGTLKNESILEILEIIKHTLPIQYKIEGQKIQIDKN